MRTPSFSNVNDEGIIEVAERSEHWTANPDSPVLLSSGLGHRSGLLSVNVTSKISIPPIKDPSGGCKSQPDRSMWMG
jgi:hypothetical protein